ncbi:hypothetical protein EDD96_1511 [Streptomyces sp. Ag109_G2-6]|nr:hypothetical protein EDD96_1511 [Streptomyces sp. Ag109_G2-6]
MREELRPGRPSREGSAGTGAVRGGLRRGRRGVRRQRTGPPDGTGPRLTGPGIAGGGGRRLVRLTQRGTGPPGPGRRSAGSGPTVPGGARAGRCARSSGGPAYLRGSGPAGDRTAARTPARRGTGAGGVEPRGEVLLVRGHGSEPVSGAGPGQPLPLGSSWATEPSLTWGFLSQAAENPWLDFIGPQRRSHASFVRRPGHGGWVPVPWGSAPDPRHTAANSRGESRRTRHPRPARLAVTVAADLDVPGRGRGRGGVSSGAKTR